LLQLSWVQRWKRCSAAICSTNVLAVLLYTPLPWPTSLNHNSRTLPPPDTSVTRPTQYLGIDGE
jgi:hypothetical protein